MIVSNLFTLLLASMLALMVGKTVTNHKKRTKKLELQAERNDIRRYIRNFTDSAETFDFANNVHCGDSGSGVARIIGCNGDELASSDGIVNGGYMLQVVCHPNYEHNMALLVRAKLNRSKDPLTGKPPVYIDLFNGIPFIPPGEVSLGDEDDEELPASVTLSAKSNIYYRWDASAPASNPKDGGKDYEPFVMDIPAGFTQINLATDSGDTWSYRKGKSKPTITGPEGDVDKKDVVTYSQYRRDNIKETPPMPWGTLIGMWTDGTNNPDPGGELLQPFEIGVGKELIVPEGATELVLAMHDQDHFVDNSGSMDVEITGIRGDEVGGNILGSCN